MPKEQRENDIQLLEQAIQLIGEHFDTVHIFVTRHEPEIEDGTVHCQKGTGNWFARYGSIKEWVIREEHLMKMRDIDDNDR